MNANPVTPEEVLQLQGQLKQIDLPLRSLTMIAAEINTHMYQALLRHPPKIPAWIHYSRPYVTAMRQLNSITDRYGLESAYEIVLRCVCNMQSWRGEDARRIKAELQRHLDSCPEANHL